MALLCGSGMPHFGLGLRILVESPAIRQAYKDAKVFSFDQSLAEMVTKLARVPLLISLVRSGNTACPPMSSGELSKSVRGLRWPRSAID
jgi:hypothetical protein